jgi:DNA invertase Pin-like site-specific DNA recombinase
MKTRTRWTLVQLGTSLIAAAALLSLLPPAANASDSKFASLATAPLARGAGYERPNGSHQVRVLQRQLRRLGDRPGPIDGLFGPLTERGVRRFQRRSDLRVDGIVGPKTAAHLARSMAAVHRHEAKHRRVEDRRRIHRSLTNDGRAVLNSGHTQQSGSMPGAADRETRGRTGGASTLLVDVLIAICAALVVALLSILTARSRTTRTVRRTSRMAEPLAAMPEPAAEAGHSEPAAKPAASPTSREPAATPAKSSAGEPLGSGVAVIGYVCVGEQERLANGEDYAAQVQAIQTLCRERGFRLVRIVRDVEGANTRAAVPPGLQHACQALGSGEAGALVVQGLGRLTRSPARLALLLRWLADADRALIAIDSDLDTWTAAGRRTARALIEVGDWERERRAERRTRKGDHAGASGRPAVRDLPELHARIAAMREEGLSLHAIADTLNAEGVPTLRGGTRWRASSVQAAVGYKRPITRGVTAGLMFPPPRPPAADEEEER